MRELDSEVRKSSYEKRSTKVKIKHWTSTSTGVQDSREQSRIKTPLMSIMKLLQMPQFSQKAPSIWSWETQPTLFSPAAVTPADVSVRKRKYLVVPRSWWGSFYQSRVCPWSCVVWRDCGPSVVCTAYTRNWTSLHWSRMPCPWTTPQGPCSRGYQHWHADAFYWN